MVKNDKPLFSILLPTHNRADVMGFSIKSVLAQSVKNFELLVVGDGCTDSTDKIVKDFVKEDSRVRWFSFPKGKGFGYEHRNVVLKMARGKYLAFAAHDDIWFPDHLEKFVQFFESNKDCEFAYSRPLWIHSDGTLIPSSFNIQNEISRKVFLKSHNEIPAHCVIHSKKSAENLGFLNTKLKQAADWDLWKRIIRTKSDSKIGFIAEPTAVHFRANWRGDKNYMNEKLIALHKKIIKENDFSDKLRIESKKNMLQESLWDEMITDENWVNKTRETIVKLFDYLNESTALLMRENMNLRININAIKKTKGYRILEFLRKLI